jgi:hypothetical protein
MEGDGGITEIEVEVVSRSSKLCCRDRFGCLAARAGVAATSKKRGKEKRCNVIQMSGDRLR